MHRDAEKEFFTALQKLIDGSKIVIDRAKGSRHPRFDNTIYPLDYGYLDGTTAADGSGIDVWFGSLSGNKLTAVIAVCDLMKKDTELKLCIDCNDEDVVKILKHHRKGSMTAIRISNL